MKLKEVQRKEDKIKRKVTMSIRTTKEVSEWMKENNVSPTRVFDLAIEELRKEK